MAISFPFSSTQMHPRNPIWRDAPALNAYAAGLTREAGAVTVTRGLMDALEQVGFSVVGYGCTTCIGNSGPLKPEIEKAIADHDLVVASVLSGNRNFEARVHQAVKANFLMSPPLVVAFALAGRVDIDFEKEALGTGKDGQPVYLRDLWPSHEEVAAVMNTATDPAANHAATMPAMKTTGNSRPLLL